MNWREFWNDLADRSVVAVYSPLEIQALLLALYFGSKDMVILGITLATLALILQYVLIKRKKSAA